MRKNIIPSRFKNLSHYRQVFVDAVIESMQVQINGTARLLHQHLSQRDLGQLEIQDLIRKSGCAYYNALSTRYLRFNSDFIHCKTQGTLIQIPVMI